MFGFLNDELAVQPAPDMVFGASIAGLLSDSQGNHFRFTISILCKQWLCKHCRRKPDAPRTLVDVNEGNSRLLLRVLGQRIRELRTEQGYSQEGFADKCGVHRTFMGTVERGESNLSFQNIVRVANTLGVPLSTLFLGLEGKAQSLAPQSPAKAMIKPKKRVTRKNDR